MSGTTYQRDRMPDYLRDLLSGRWEVSPGELVEVVVRHGRDCAHWQAKPCDCEPALELQAVEETPPKIRAERKEDFDDADQG